MNINDINKIYCDDQITVKKVNMTSLLFIDNKVVSKTNYSVVDHYINILEQAYDNLSFYQHKGSSYYYEFHKSLKDDNTIITGIDIFGNSLTGITDTNSLIFVNGYKLLPSQYTKSNDGKSITIITPFYDKEVSTIIIYVSDSILYMGNIETASEWDYQTHSFNLKDYTCLRYLFFKNGELIKRDLISEVNNKVTINVDIREGIDIIEYYQLPIDTESLVFDATPGYLSYGPRDNLNFLVPERYDAEVTFQSIVRLAIDDVRKGFFICEENGNGCLMITSEDFETRVAYCTSIVDFSKDLYTKEEYFVKVPEARSILKYISEYDLNRMLMPEILGSFQKLLLDETYDSIQRLKNIRSINRVGSSQITQFIKFLGLNIDVTDLTLVKKHALLEELTNFYNVVGTKESYNFYNTMTSNSKIVTLNQLFTPIKDYINLETGDSAKRYIDFRTAEELGAVTHKRYEFTHYDLGEVDQLANPEDSFSNQPRSSGQLENPNELPILNNTRIVIYPLGKLDSENDKNILDENDQLIAKIDSNNNILNLNNIVIGTVNNIFEIKNKEINSLTRLVMIKEEIPVQTNLYIEEPVAGPNKPSIDLGTLPIPGEPDNATSFYNLGLVSETIKGHWIEWTEWDRPKNWYPTNHVEVAVQIPPAIDYKTFMTEFKNTFYDIASAVLYIHSIIEVYVFGKEDPVDGANFGIVTVPFYYSLEWAMTNDPRRQDYRYD